MDMQQIKRVFGTAMDIIFGLGDGIVEAGGDAYQGLHHIITPEGKGTLARIGGILADATNPYIHMVTVERRISLNDAIMRCHLDEIDLRIQEIFFSLPEHPDIIRETIPVISLSSIDMAVIGKQGRRPITLGELLAMVASENGCNSGATFALGTVAKTPEGDFVCYIDEVFGDWDDKLSGRPLHRSLRTVRLNRLLEKIQEIAKRPKENCSNESWFPAVRE